MEGEWCVEGYELGAAAGVLMAVVVAAVYCGSRSGDGARCCIAGGG